MVKNNLVGTEFESRRRIDFLTPDSLCKKIMIVSTTVGDASGETAIMQVSALNCFHASKIMNDNTWKIIKEHKMEKEAMKFHDDYVNKLEASDCEESE